MSELKAYEAYICSNEFLPENVPKGCEAIVRSNSIYEKDDWWDNAKEFECYIKSEADKEIEFWKKESHEHYERWFNLNKQFEGWFGKVVRCERAERELRHHKYKRCLAMAERCKDKIENVVQYNEHDDWLIINEYWERWHERWLKIAEQFKEAKCQ